MRLSSTGTAYQPHQSPPYRTTPCTRNGYARIRGTGIGERPRQLETAVRGTPNSARTQSNVGSRRSTILDLVETRVSTFCARTGTSSTLALTARSVLESDTQRAPENRE